jgi:hypothetical protein
MNIFKKINVNQVNTSVGQKAELYLNEGQTHSLAACIIMGFFFTFMLGYYWGKKSAVADVMQAVSQEVLADQVYTTLLGDRVVIGKDGESYVQLGKYSNQKEAEKALDKIVPFDGSARIVEQESRTSGGEKYTWYQIVMPYNIRRKV